jgi:hypothetical protein
LIKGKADDQAAGRIPDHIVNIAEFVEAPKLKPPCVNIAVEPPIENSPLIKVPLPAVNEYPFIATLVTIIISYCKIKQWYFYQKAFEIRILKHRASGHSLYLSPL